ncbi:MAG: HAMP domain-containing histidine kinase [Muribaculaceae bacterium]|nr:HAMP domain-containing histidine kinase [Muribaculaceae bacterium]
MPHKRILRLHWKLFFPLVGLLWLIIGITIFYFVSHEKQRQKENLENRLLNVNNTVIDAYERGVDLQKTVDFIRLFTNKTTLDPLRITVYDSRGRMIADNPGATITLYDGEGRMNPELRRLWDASGHATVEDMAYDRTESMISSRTSPDGRIHSFAALPYEGEVLAFLSIDPMVWVAVIVLGVLLSVLAYFGVRAVCRNVYTLRDFARALSADDLPDDISSWRFSNDELGDVSRNLLSVYREKIHAEQEKSHYERQIGMNISHELNTPVGIIKGYLDSVLDDDGMPDELRRRFLERARQNADRLTSIVSDISTVMRLQDQGSHIEVAPVDFHRLVERLAEDVRQGHIADGMEFCRDVTEGCVVEGHEPLLANAMLNLVYNAARHSGGTRMEIRWLREEGGRHYFEFADNGTGVDDEHLARLFDLFYRVDAGRSRKNGGSGLGLPLVRRILAAMGGDITVANVPSGGLCFTFSLPAAAPAA